MFWGFTGMVHEPARILSYLLLFIIILFVCLVFTFSPSISTYFMQAQFSQMRPVAMVPSVGPRMPMYPPGAPGLGQQFLYGQGPPAIIPPQVITNRYLPYHSILIYVDTLMF